MSFVSLQLCTWHICQGHTGGHDLEHTSSCDVHFRIYQTCLFRQHPSEVEAAAGPRVPPELQVPPLWHLQRLQLTGRHLEQALSIACPLARCLSSRCQVVLCITLSTHPLKLFKDLSLPAHYTIVFSSIPAHRPAPSFHAWKVEARGWETQASLLRLTWPMD